MILELTMSNPPPFEFPRNPEQRHAKEPLDLRDRLDEKLPDRGEMAKPTTELVSGKTIIRTGTAQGKVKR